jgi:ABC-type oligopeptide transport system substrate-binding subunit
MKTERLIKKYDGNGNIIMVPNPDYWDEENHFHKVRRKPTNFTPKKKKRKK